MIREYSIREYSYKEEVKVSLHALQLFAAFLFFLFIPLKDTGLVHYVILLGVILTTGNVVLTIYKNGAEKIHVLIFTLLLVDMAVSLLTTNEQLSSGLLYSIVGYFSLFWIIALSDVFFRDKKTIDTIYRFGICSGLLFSVYSLMPFAYYRDNNTISPTLTLYFGNSNLTGIYIFASVCIIIIYIKCAQRKAIWRFLAATLVAYLLYLLWMTGARTCMIATAFVIASAILPIRIKIPKLVVIGCFVFPIIFIPIYLALYRSGYANLTIMGKELFSGRQGTFTDYLSLLKTDFQWVVGNLGEAGFENAHNAPLAHLCSTGLIGLILFYGVMFEKTMSCTESNDIVARTSLICILGLFIQSSGEASIFLGGFPGIVFVYIFFFLAGQRKLSYNG